MKKNLVVKGELRKMFKWAIRILFENHEGIALSTDEIVHEVYNAIDELDEEGKIQYTCRD